MDYTIEPLKAALASRYRIGRTLGRGGMATVYLAYELKHGRKVALKVMHPDLAATLGRERFLREIRLGAGLQHPHILPLLDSGEAAGFLYYVMPYLEGQSLRELMDQQGPLSVAQALRITCDVGEALDKAHQKGVIHRDVKPENIMLSGGHAVLMDFGIARAVGAAGSEITGSGLVVGTPRYMSPEQALGASDVDGRSDIYSLAAVAYEMLAGFPPFGGGSPESVMARKLKETVPPLSGARPDVPTNVSRALATALSRMPGERQASAADLCEALSIEAPSASSVARRPKAKMRLADWIAFVTLVALAITSVGRGSTASGVAPSPSKIAVLPFEVRNGDETLGTGVAGLLSTKLDGAGPLIAIEPRALSGVADREAEITIQSASAISRRFGAGLFVLGELIQVGDSLTVGATVYEGEHAVRVSHSVRGPTAQLFDLVDQLAASLLVGIADAGAPRVNRIAGVTTASFEAYKAYLAGDEAYRRGQYPPAIEAFQRAVTLDSTFALAYYRLSIAAEWNLMGDLSQWAAESAVRHASRLSRRDRRMLNAFLQRRSGHNIRAEQSYRRVLSTYPDDLDALIDLGEILFHAGPLRGRSFRESEAAFGRVLELDPSHSTTLLHMARIMARDGRLAEMDSHINRFVAQAPEGDRTLEIRALQAWAHGDTMAQNSLRSRLKVAPDETVALALWSVANYALDLHGADAIARELTAPWRTAEARSLGLTWRAHIALARGRWREANELIGQIEDPGLALEQRALLANIPFAPVSWDTLVALREQLRALDPATIARSGSKSIVMNVNDGIHPEIRWYFMGLISARLSDTAAAQRYADELRRLPAERSSALAQDFAVSIEATVARSQGRTEQALATLESASRRTWYGQTMASPYYSQARERYLQAETLMELGRHEAALNWLSSMIEMSPFELAYLPLVHLRCAEIFERQGRRSEALAEYQAFLSLWGRADPELLPLVDEVVDRLARLEATAPNTLTR